MASNVNSSVLLDFETKITPTVVVPCTTAVLNVTNVVEATQTAVSESNNIVMNTGDAGVDY